MANYFSVVLDTLGPANPSILIAGGSTYTAVRLVTCSLSTDDVDTTGYQMKIWGDVDVAYDTNIQSVEGASSWIAYTTSKQVNLSSTEGVKTVYFKVRDDVRNESSIVSDTVALDSTLPVVTISGPDTNKVSKIAGKDVVSFSFSVDSSFVEYKVKVVSSIGATEDTGILIGTANGSTNMAATGTFSTTINCSIKGADLEAASSGDGSKIIKVFAKDSASNWSV
jgi:hypothetical protein